VHVTENIVVFAVPLSVSYRQSLTCSLVIVGYSIANCMDLGFRAQVPAELGFNMP